MSRRKKRSAGREPGPKPAGSERPNSPPRPAPVPNPPRPNQWFLGTTALLLAAWVGFLLLLALAAKAR